MDSRVKILELRAEGCEALIVLSAPLTDENKDFLGKLNIGDYLRAKLSKWREKRSLTANGYFHHLSDRLAEVMGHSKAYMKNYLICHYGQPEILNDNPVWIETIIPYEKAMESVEPHLRLEAIDVSGDEDRYTYTIMRNSRTYDTKEFSILLDGAVQEAMQVGIPIKTDKELMELLEKWEADREINNKR